MSSVFSEDSESTKNIDKKNKVLNIFYGVALLLSLASFILLMIGCWRNMQYFVFEAFAFSVISLGMMIYFHKIKLHHSITFIVINVLEIVFAIAQVFALIALIAANK